MTSRSPSVTADMTTTGIRSPAAGPFRWMARNRTPFMMGIMRLAARRAPAARSEVLQACSISASAP